MPRRSKSFDKLIAEKMKDPEYARESLLTSIEEFGESVEEALKYSIELMGIKEFSEVSGIRIQNISDFIKGRKNLKLETLDKYLSVFGLKSKIIVTEVVDVA